jgi:hypothetical protein
MKLMLRRAATTAAISALMVAGSAGAAQARTTIISIGNSGTGNGNVVFAPVQIPVNVCGVALTVSGAAFAFCRGGATAVIR